jgi:hypothetical protein
MNPARPAAETENGQQTAEPENGRETAEAAAENERLRARVAALEAELVEVQSRANAAVAARQEQAYWLDRWHLDLNALMRRPSAAALVGALRGGRGAWRRAKRLKRRLRGS